MKKSFILALSLAATILVSCTDLSNYYTKDEIDAMQDDQQVSFFAKVNTSYDWPINGSVQQVRFDTTVSNIGGAYNDSSNTFIVPVGGTYSFSGNVRFNSIAQGNLVYVVLRAELAGVDTVNHYGDWTYSGGTSIGLSLSKTLVLSAGTRVQLWAYVNSSTAPATVFGNITDYYFTCFYGVRVR